VVALAAGAQAQELGASGFTGGGGAQSNDELRHFAAFGVGMAVGGQEGEGMRARHGLLARGAASDDDTPPTITEIDDIAAETGAEECVAVVQLPAVEVSDNRDRSPDVTVTLRTDPAQNIAPGGAEVELPPGSYDVVITAVDGSGNRANESYRIDVTDGLPPAIVPIPNPTPEGDEAEARSPAGTAVAIAFRCEDACDESPDQGRDPARARYPVGNTNITVFCVDESDNRAEAQVVVRVRDTTGPRVAGQMPDDINEECNNRQGAEIDVPRLVWADNASSADDLTLSLIVRPGEEDERVFEGEDYPPDSVLLTRGEHTFRYTATDEAGNTSVADLTVNVTDNGVPQLDVISAPEGGWHNGDGALQVVLGISDGCGGDGAADLDIDISPQPEQTAIDGDRVTITYNQPGIYNLTIEVTDDAGNEASDNSVGFGIDRDEPSVTVAVPSQVGVNVDDEDTHPLLALGELLQLNVGGAEDGDGVVSGIANVSVVIDPEGMDRQVADTDFRGNGNPERGQRVASNVGCEIEVNGNDVNDGWCSEDAELNLRRIGSGAHEAVITVTDFAGNSATSTAYFLAVNLVDGLPFIEDQLAAIVAAAPPAAVRGRAAQALGHVRRAMEVSDLQIEDNPYGVPVFLGGALRFVQNATIALNQAIGAANGDVEDDLQATQHLLLRLAKSDVALLQQTAVDDGQPAAGFRRTAFTVDSDFVDDADVVLRDNLAGEEWNAGAANALIGLFHAKSMYESWILDWSSQPNAFDRPGLVRSYEGAFELLTDIRDELTAYLTLADAPGQGPVRDLRDRLSAVIEDLAPMVADANNNGIADLFEGDPGDPEVGMSDEDYVTALIALRAATNFSVVAANSGVWTRNYEWPMMQAVRFFTQASIESAIAVRGGGRADWPVYARGLELIAGGADELDDREVQAVINRFGSELDSICLIVAVYHCDFLDDEGADDEDRPWNEDDDILSDCWARMWRPSEWPDVPVVDRIRPQCQYAPEGDLRE